MPKAYSYIRFSTPDQAKGDSYRRQKEAAERFCMEHGLELATAREYTFFDRGRSAYSAKHLDDDEGQLRRFLGLVEDGTIEAGSYLLVESLDRLSREKVSVALPRFMDLLNKGITVVTLADGRVYDANFNDLDLIISIVHMSRAHNESSMKGLRVSAAWDNKKKLARSEQKPLGRACPYWLELKGGGYMPIPERVDAVRLIFDLTVSGYGQTKVSKLLNDRGIAVFGSSARNKGGAWGTSSVNKILNNRALLGEYQPTRLINRSRVNDGDPIKGLFPVVISEDTFYAAMAARAERKIMKASRQSANYNVFQGITKCARCGAAMHLINKGSPPKGYTYLQCHSAKKGVCDNGMVRIERAEQVFREVLTKVDSLSLVQESAGTIRKSLAVMEGKLSEASAKLQAAEAAQLEFPSAAGARLLQQLEKEVASLHSEQEQLKEKLASETIVSKEDFFRKLDLISYAGRAAANSLVKRLGLYIYVERRSRYDVYFYVSRERVFSSYSSLFAVHINRDGHVAIQAFDGSVAKLQVIQGELHAEQAQLEAEDGVSAHWFGEFGWNNLK